MTTDKLELKIGSEWVEVHTDGVITFSGGEHPIDETYSGSRIDIARRQPTQILCNLTYLPTTSYRRKLKRASDDTVPREFRVTRSVHSQPTTRIVFSAFVINCGSYTGQLKLATVMPLPEWEIVKEETDV